MTRSRSPSERRAMFARMGKDYHAMNRDMPVRAANTLPDTPENRKEWVKDSRRIDIEGIDTPSDMKTVLIIQSAKPYPDDLKIENREEFYDEKFWYDPDRGRHPASGSGRLPTKHVPFYEVVDVGGKNKWKVVNPYTGEIKYYPYGEHNAAKAYYDGLYDDYSKSKKQDRKQQTSSTRMSSENKYLGKTVEDIQEPGLSNLSEVRDIRDNIIRDRKTSKISKSEAASRMNLLKLVSMRDSDFQVVRKKTRAKSIVDEGIEELKEM